MECVVFETVELSLELLLSGSCYSCCSKLYNKTKSCSVEAFRKNSVGLLVLINKG